MKRTSVVLAFIVAAGPVVALGAEPCKKARVVQSPCSGLLVPATDAQACIRCLDVDLPSCWLTVENIGEQHKIIVDALRQDIEAQRDALENAEALAADLAEQLEPPRWYESPILWAGVGVVVGLAAGIAIFVAVDRD